MTELENVRAALAASRVNADRMYARQRHAAKQSAVLAHQQGKITAEEYAEIVGETYADTLREEYNIAVSDAKERTASRVRGGFLTPEDYQAITGEEYREVIE